MLQARTLEDRIRAIEDRLEILNLIASHPPSADTGADYYTRAAYVADGELDLGRGKAVAGNETIAAITRTPAHQAAIAGGLAHITGLPRIGTALAVLERLRAGSAAGPRAAAEPFLPPGDLFDRIAPGIDDEVVKHFHRALARQGLKFKLGAKVTGAETAASGVKLVVEPAKGGAAETLEVAPSGGPLSLPLQGLYLRPLPPPSPTPTPFKFGQIGRAHV